MKRDESIKIDKHLLARIRDFARKDRRTIKAEIEYVLRGAFPATGQNEGKR